MLRDRMLPPHCSQHGQVQSSRYTRNHWGVAYAHVTNLSDLHYLRGAPARKDCVFGAGGTAIGRRFRPELRAVVPGVEYANRACLATIVGPGEAPRVESRLKCFRVG